MKNISVELNRLIDGDIDTKNYLTYEPILRQEYYKVQEEIDIYLGQLPEGQYEEL